MAVGGQLVTEATDRLRAAVVGYPPSAVRSCALAYGKLIPPGVGANLPAWERAREALPGLRRNGARMTAALTYSTAERCPTCDGRAILTEAQADRLAAATSGRLEAFICLEGLGWHVWHPAFELPGTHARP
ncbi:MAG: hypothetical protein M3R63_22150 [Actinomycetota bacterium]|nr:hypothetical protein [Actinomycetota bacterium]